MDAHLVEGFRSVVLAYYSLLCCFLYHDCQVEIQWGPAQQPGLEVLMPNLRVSGLGLDVSEGVNGSCMVLKG